MESNKDVWYYVGLMAEYSKTRYHELIELCLTEFDLNATIELTVEEAKEFCKRHGLIKSKN